MSIFEIHSFLGLAGYYKRFENGLKLSIRGKIVGFRLRDMDSMVGTTLTRILETLRIRVLVTRGRISFLLVRGRGRRLLLHTSFRTRARIEHVRRECPQKHGSQDFGTAQSQLVVEQENIRFIPPHPSTGQRNKFKFRGVVQALPATQIGQRGQSVGRSQGQIRVTQQKRSGP